VRQSGHCEIVRRISVTLAKLIFGRQTFVSVIVTTSIPMPFKLRHRAQATIVRRPMLLMIAALIALASGCATINPLHSVREKMAAGQYAAARQELLAMQLDKLSPGQRREVKDDLCVSEYMMGEPNYSIGEQRRICADAATEPGSRSGEIVAKIDDTIRRTSYGRVNAALASGDLGGAEQAAQVYVSTPGADPLVVAKWSHQMWELVTRRDHRVEQRHKKDVAAAIAALRKEYPAVRKMSKDDFMAWVAKEGSVEGTAMFSSVALRDKELDLAVRRPQLPVAALELDRLAEINDAGIARCGCDGHTNVGIAETNFPLYLVRLDPETQRSEVLIMPHRQ
jgi:hypothetical protein